MAKLDFYYDLSSPWTRLAFHNVQPIVAECGATITYIPILVGGVFNAVNQSVYAMRQEADNPKFRLTGKWLKDWARLAGVRMNFPSPHHPLKSVKAMRMCCVLEEDQTALKQFSDAAFEAYFGDARNLDDPDVLLDVANACGFDGASLLKDSESEANKARLRANTQAVIDSGGFGSPTMVVDGKKLFFGNDQLPLVRQALNDAAS